MSLEEQQEDTGESAVHLETPEQQSTALEDKLEDAPGGPMHQPSQAGFACHF